MKEKIYYIGALIIFCVYYFGTFILAYKFETTIPLMFSNIILLFVWMNYVDKKWKEKEK